MRFFYVPRRWRNDGCFYMSFEDWVPRRAAYHLGYVTSYRPSDFPTKVSIGDNDESCSRSTLKHSKTCTNRQDLALQLWIVDLCPKGKSHISPSGIFHWLIGMFLHWLVLGPTHWIILFGEAADYPPLLVVSIVNFGNQFWTPVPTTYIVKNNKSSVVIQAKPLPTLWGANIPDVSK